MEILKKEEGGKQFNGLAEGLLMSGISDAIKPIISGFIKDAKNFVGKDERRILIQYVENDKGEGDVLAIIIKTASITQELDFTEDAIINEKGEETVYKVEQYATDFIAGKFDMK
jgi:hypothetical protein